MLNKRCIDPGFPMNDGSMTQGPMNPEMMMNKGMECSMPKEHLQGMVCQPVYECPQERCCHRQIIHEVPHVVPVHTRVINHHIYKHSYTPCFTCCEENVCTNVVEGPHCGC